MSRGGKRVGAGRKAGAKNKRTLEIEKKVASTGITPLDYMLQVLRNPNAPKARRDEMAKAAAPYIHSRMPVALVPGKPPGEPQADQEDEKILDLYLRGVHEEAEGN